MILLRLLHSRVGFLWFDLRVIQFLTLVRYANSYKGDLPFARNLSSKIRQQKSTHKHADMNARSRTEINNHAGFLEDHRNYVDNISM